MNYQIYCSICGAPTGDVYRYGYGESLEWLNDVVLLTTAHRVAGGIELDEYRPPNQKCAYAYDLGSDPPSDEIRSVLRLDAYTDDGAVFEIRSTGDRVIPMKPKFALQRFYTRGGPLYMPTHRSCLTVADNFIDGRDAPVQASQSQNGAKITSVKQLWEVIYRRLRGVHSPSTWVLPEPHDYFGGKLCRNLSYEADEDEEFAKLHESNPIEIPSMTDSILQNLKPIAVTQQNQDLEQDPLSNVNRDLQKMSLNCDYERSPSWWCSIIQNKQTFPWLWDLDLDAVRSKQLEGNWDWELLVRQLSQLNIHEPDDTSIDIPHQLRNRRRIWRILEEARVNDIAGPEEEAMAAALAKKEEEMKLPEGYRWEIPAVLDGRTPIKRVPIER